MYFHGPAYQVLEQAWRANGNVIGRFADELPANHEPPGRPTEIAPRLIELCFQTAGVSELASEGRMALPTHVDRVIRYATGKKPSRLWAVVTPRDGGADAEIIDEGGRVRVKLEGYRTIVLPGELEAEALAPIGPVSATSPGDRGRDRARSRQTPVARRHRRSARGRAADRRGHAIEARLNAEDPALGFAPAHGLLSVLRLPTGPGLRVDTGVAEGDLIPPEFDSMIAKVIAWGRDRDEALARLHRGLADTLVVVDGGTTNQGFLLDLLDRPEVRSGDVDTAWLDRLDLSGEATPARHADVALVQAAIELADEDLAADRARFYAYARRGRPQATAELSRSYELRHRGQSYRLRVAHVAPDRYRVSVDGHQLELETRRIGQHERRLLLPGRSYRTVSSKQENDVLVEVSGVPHRISRDDGGIVRNVAPAVVVSIPVAEGDVVDVGDVVAVVEAMKMESSLVAPFRGRVKQVFVGENVHVGAQAPLLALDPVEEQDAAPSGTRLSFTELAGAAKAVIADQCRENLLRMEWLVRGYDVGPAEVDRAIADLHGLCADLLACDPALVPGEHRLLRMFADLGAISSPLPRDEGEDPEQLQGSQEHLHHWLRSLDAESEGLPEPFVSQLRRALAYYGIESLERTPALEDASYRLFLSQQRSAAARRGILAILDRRLEEAEQLIGHVGDDFREALNRLIIALDGRDQNVADLAREVRLRYFDEPVIAAATERVYADTEQHVAALIEDPRRADREQHIEAIVDCPRPLSTRLSTAMRHNGPPVRDRLVEAMARRYYRVRSLEGFEDIELGGHRFVVGRYRFHGTQRHILAAYVEVDEIGSAARAFVAWAAKVPAGELAVLDLYAEHAGAAPSHEQLAAMLAHTYQGIDVPPALHRIVAAIAEPRRGRGMSAIDLFTFRPSPEGGLVEDAVLRGLHPMMGHRLQVWRLGEFDLERLPSPEDIYAFHGVAQANPKDERLFVLAEVRDFTPVHDEHGEVVGLPELEQMLVHVFSTLRGYQAHRPVNRRLLWNRVLLHVWPVMEPSPDELRRFIQRLVPLTAGLGIEVILLQGRVRESDGEVRRRVLRFYMPTPHEVRVEVDDPSSQSIKTLDEGARRIISARRRGTLHPSEIVKLIAPPHATSGQPRGEFIEHELSEQGRLEPVDRPPAMNPSGIVAGTIKNFTERYPKGMRRVILLGDPTRALGSLAEPECRRIMAAIDLAEELGVPLEWFALSAGAKIAMDSGTETMDWIGAVLRRIILFTQAGGEINVVVAGINVGAQPYWNAEATMLMHTRGALIMTPESAMVLTGKQALDHSGGVSAEDNFGIGGYDRIMGPNGQAQYWARDLPAACRLLLSYYDHTLRRARRALPAPGEHLGSGGPGRRRGRARRPRLRVAARRRHLLRRDEPRPQEGVRYPFGDARRDRQRSRAARTLGADALGRDRGHLGRSPRRTSGVTHRDRVKADPAARATARRRSRGVDVRHAVPPLGEEDRPRDQCGRWTATDRRACQPGRVRWLARVNAGNATRVRR